MNLHLFCQGLSDKPQHASFTYYPKNSVISGRYGDLGQDKDVVKRFLENKYRGEYASQEQLGSLTENVVNSYLEYELVDCELNTISNVILENGIEKIDLLKIDVEKSELDVLLGINLSLIHI